MVTGLKMEFHFIILTPTMLSLWIPLQFNGWNQKADRSLSLDLCSFLLLVCGISLPFLGHETREHDFKNELIFCCSCPLSERLSDWSYKLPRGLGVTVSKSKTWFDKWPGGGKETSVTIQTELNDVLVFTSQASSCIHLIYYIIYIFIYKIL